MFEHLILYWIHTFFFFPLCDPEQITSVDSLVMTKVACGDSHSMALNEWGQLYTWGSDAHHQLGKIESYVFRAIFQWVGLIL